MNTTVKLVAALVAALALAWPAAAQDGGRISVVGAGSVAVKPDIARLTVGALAREPTAARATAALSQRLAGILGALARAGVADDDVQTGRLDVGPVHLGSSSGNQPEISGYEAMSQLVVTVRDLGRLGVLIDLVIDSGANQMGGIGFDTSTPGPALDRARTLAVQDARHKAEVFANAAGASLGPIVTMRAGGGNGGPLFMAQAASLRGAMPVAQGRISISAEIEIEWRLAPGGG